MDDEWVKVPEGYMRVSDGKRVRIESGLAVWGMDTELSEGELEMLTQRAGRDAERDERGELSMDE